MWIRFSLKEPAFQHSLWSPYFVQGASKGRRMRQKSIEIAKQDAIKFSCICCLSQLQSKICTVEMLFSVGAVGMLFHLKLEKNMLKSCNLKPFCKSLHVTSNPFYKHDSQMKQPIYRNTRLYLFELSDDDLSKDYHHKSFKDAEMWQAVKSYIKHLFNG